jgi:hypothetical protein
MDSFALWKRLNGAISTGKSITCMSVNAPWLQWRTSQPARCHLVAWTVADLIARINSKVKNSLGNIEFNKILRATKIQERYIILYERIYTGLWELEQGGVDVLAVPISRDDKRDVHEILALNLQRRAWSGQWQLLHAPNVHVWHLKGEGKKKIEIYGVLYIEQQSWCP